ncbi:MAG: HupE/UreJ family protein [Campylobacterales bacterium]
MGKGVLFTILALLFFSKGVGHPLNLTKMELNLSSGQLWLRFTSFNLIKPLNLSENPDDKEAYRRKGDIQKFTIDHLQIFRGGERCQLTPTEFRVNNLIVIDENFTLSCPNHSPDLKIRFDLFFSEDPTQTGVMKLERGERVETLLFSPGKEEYRLVIGSELSTFKFFVKEGILHIWEGTDHLTFLFLLIIPSLLVGFGFRENLVELLKIVTAFTLSHSITLSLSVFNILSPPSPVVEVGIAVTILLTALNNLFHWVPFKYEWLTALLFGFIHGFGFATALKELNLATYQFAKVVFGFNLGVEIGQGILVALIFPLLYLFRIRFPTLYRHFFQLGSGVGLLLALYWILQRTPSLFQ